MTGKRREGRQWGRDRLAAEGVFGLGALPPEHRVNGAATVWPRKAGTTLSTWLPCC